MSRNSSTSSSANPNPYASTVDGGERHQRPGHAERHHHTEELQPGLFFLISRAVTLCYGPYVVLGVMDYRTDRLQGLNQALQKAGGEVKILPSYHVNEVRVWHLEKLIFTCKITDLMFGGDGGLDPICKAAEEALEQSSRRAYFNLKYRYHLDKCLLTPCPCHPDQHENDSLARIPCKKVKVNQEDGTQKKCAWGTKASPGKLHKRNPVEPDDLQPASPTGDQQANK